jgi:hypothetical protein
MNSDVELWCQIVFRVKTQNIVVGVRRGSPITTTTAREKGVMLEEALEGEAARATASSSADSYEAILQVLADRFGNPSQVIKKLEAKPRQVASKLFGENPTTIQLREKHTEVCNQRQGLFNQGIQLTSFDSHNAQEILLSMPVMSLSPPFDGGGATGPGRRGSLACTFVWYTSLSSCVAHPEIQWRGLMDTHPDLTWRSCYLQPTVLEALTN